MYKITYRQGCRHCHQAEDIDRQLITKSEKDILNVYGIPKSEFELAFNIERLLENKQASCPYCDKLSWDIWDVKVNGRKLFVKNDDSSQFILIIDRKDSNGGLDIKTGGSTYLPKGFPKRAVQHMAQALDKIPTNRFIYNPKIGGAEIAVSSTLLNDMKEIEMVVKFSHTGLLKEEISKAIQLLSNHFN